MQLRQVKNIYFKEILDLLKDRRTVISMIVIPILLFPVVMFGLGAVMSSQIKKVEEKAKAVAIFGAEYAPNLVSLILADGRFEQVGVPKDSIQPAIQDKRLEAALEFPADFEAKLDAGDTAQVIIYYDQAEFRSETAENQLKAVIREFEDKIVEIKLMTVNLNKNSIHPVKIASKNLAPPEKMGGVILSIFLPYMLMILCLNGGMYPAMDLTAGEKERGTLETLLVSPASRLDIAAGKFLAVLTASFITGILGTASMGISSMMGFAGFDENAPAGISVNPLSILVLILLILPLACLFSSLLLSLSLTARSYKEAQSYVSPLMIVVIFPAFASFLPGFEFQTIHTFIPVLNTSLLLKEVLQGTFPWGKIALVFLVNAIYAGLGIFMAKKMFEKESVLFRI